MRQTKNLFLYDSTKCDKANSFKKTLLIGTPRNKEIEELIRHTQNGSRLKKLINWANIICHGLTSIKKSWAGIKKLRDKRKIMTCSDKSIDLQNAYTICPIKP